MEGGLLALRRERRDPAQPERARAPRLTGSPGPYNFPRTCSTRPGLTPLRIAGLEADASLVLLDYTRVHEQAADAVEGEPLTPSRHPGAGTRARLRGRGRSVREGEGLGGLRRAGRGRRPSRRGGRPRRAPGSGTHPEPRRDLNERAAWPGSGAPAGMRWASVRSGAATTARTAKSQRRGEVTGYPPEAAGCHSRNARSGKWIRFRLATPRPGPL